MPGKAKGSKAGQKNSEKYMIPDLSLDTIQPPVQPPPLREGSSPNRAEPVSKRPRVKISSSDIECDDPEALFDVLIDVLSSGTLMDSFVSALCSAPAIKASLISHILPTLDQQVASIMQPLKDVIDNLHGKLNEADLKNDDLEQYTRRQSLRISGIPETTAESTDNLLVQFSKDSLGINLAQDEIDRSHRVGPRGKKKSGHHRTICEL